MMGERVIDNEDKKNNRESNENVVKMGKRVKDEQADESLKVVNE